jgi:hypothetical protein
MKYTIHYECTTEIGILKAEVIVECKNPPTSTDSHIIDVVLRDSVRFHKSGHGSTRIITIKEHSK